MKDSQYFVLHGTTIATLARHNNGINDLTAPLPVTVQIVRSTKQSLQGISSTSDCME